MTGNPVTGARNWRGLALVGYRGSGKSTVGKIVAERLNRPFLDTDQEIEARTGRSIARIFAEDGEAAFRDWEERTIALLASQYPQAVLATGGGIVLREANRRRIRDFGFVAWLRARPEELARRLGGDPESLANRPPLTHAGTIAEIVPVLAERTPLYQQVADAIIDTEATTADSVASLVIDRWLRTCKS
jgi:shikimate kinase